MSYIIQLARIIEEWVILIMLTYKDINMKEIHLLIIKVMECIYLHQLIIILIIMLVNQLNILYIVQLSAMVIWIQYIIYIQLKPDNK